jgi:FkbH-like protein
MSRAPFKKDFLAQYAWEIVRAGRALKGKAKKCVVLDCDNTLWGGVVGEDGVAGIKLDPFEYPGRCFYDFQKSILNLIDQGVIVAVCSKNNEADALEVFDNHPNSLLRRNHLAAWRINWTDKATNIAALAKELNLGLDSFVFVDDSGIECDQVRHALPDVTVIQAPKAAYELPRLLYRDGLFDGLVRSEEDAKRTESYVAERSRAEAQVSFASTEEYLASLDLKAVIHPAPTGELGRVAQLLGKTNQFNLTTRRHSEALVHELAESPDSAVYTLAAADRFGDLGLVAVLIATRKGDEGIIDSLLMSCRALGRKLEFVFVEHCLAELEARWALKTWRAAYLPTKKNAQVAEFWDSLAFTRVGSDEGGVTYELSVSNRQPKSYPFVLVSGA